MAKLKIDFVEIDVPDDENVPIGVSSSGGADSSILVFILAKHIKNKIHVITYGNRDREYHTILPSTNVVKKCVELTGNHNITHHTNYDETKTRDVYFKNLIDVVDSGLVSLMYTGTTTAPPFPAMAKFKVPLAFDTLMRRSDTVEKSFYSHENKIYHPFNKINKREIRRLYEHLGVLDSLFPLTRSCESLTQFTGHCGECWWCEERAWAFGSVA